MAEKKYCIRVHKSLVAVTPEVYKAYHSAKRRAKTLTEKDTRNGVVSYDALDTEELLGEEVIPDLNSPSVEDMAISNILIAKLHRCLAMLPEAERYLLHALYFERKSERQCAEHLGISQKAVNKRRHKALITMRKLMKV